MLFLNLMFYVIFIGFVEVFVVYIVKKDKVCFFYSIFINNVLIVKLCYEYIRFFLLKYV